MDATPLNTSIIILCSVAGCTFGSEDVQNFQMWKCQVYVGGMSGWGETEMECSRIINRKFPYLLRSSLKSSIDTIAILLVG